MHRRRILITKIAIATLAMPIIIWAYAEGPDAGLSGVPGENTCTACHSGGSGSGSVSVSFPNGLTYTPGVKQHLVVTVADSAQRRWGFQLTARQSGSSSVQAGSFTPGTDGYTQLVCTQTTFRTENFGPGCGGSTSMPLQYIEHTMQGTRNGQRNSVTFAFDWTPPSSDVGSIIIYVAANAANGDGNTGGDHIYTQHYTLTSAPAVTGPAITSVVNAASFQGPISPGSWVTITGTNLANSTRSWGASDIVNGALPTALDGVSATVNGNAAYVSYISPTRLNVLVPADSTTGSVNVQVTNNGATSAPATADLESTSPAFFMWAGKNAVATRPDFSLVGPAGLFPGVTTVPAKPGDVLILWGTGFGPTNPAAPVGQETPFDQIYSVTNIPSVQIGGTAAQVIGAALSPGAAGLYQIVVQVPQSMSAGDQPVIVQNQGGPAVAAGVLSVGR